MKKIVNIFRSICIYLGIWLIEYTQKKVTSEDLYKTDYEV